MILIGILVITVSTEGNYKRNPEHEVNSGLIRYTCSKYALILYDASLLNTQQIS